MKNSGTLINSLLMIASPSLATLFIIIVTNSHLNMLLIETSPVGGSTKFFNRRIRIHSAFIIEIIWWIICQIIQCPEFYSVNPHFATTRPMDQDRQENRRQQPHSKSNKSRDQMAAHSDRKILLEDCDSDQFENMDGHQNRILILLASSRP